MGEKTSIEWTDHTFNPWWGCTKVSPACEHCYAETFDHRLGGAHWGKNAERRFFKDSHWLDPLNWNRAAEDAGVRRRVFCASMADVFEDDRRLDDARKRLWDLIDKTPSLDWLLLTKRPHLMTRLVPWKVWPLNVWAGTTAENQHWYDIRFPELAKVPAIVRFLSVEPMLGPIDLRLQYPWHHKYGEKQNPNPPYRFGVHRQFILNWIICGGESGHGARVMQPDWVRSIRDQCEAAKVPFLFKQWGNWLPGEPDAQPPFWNFQDGKMIDSHSFPADLTDEPSGWAYELSPAIVWKNVGKDKAGRRLDGEEFTQYPIIEEHTRAAHQTCMEARA